MNLDKISKIMVNKYYIDEFINSLKNNQYDLEFSDENGYYRIMDKENRNVLVGKLKIWNNVLEYYVGLAQIRFINDLIIKFNQYLEYYDKDE